MAYECSWDVLHVLSNQIPWERWAVVKTVELLDAENTVPFIARYRKEQTNNMEPDMIRQVAEVYESLKAVQKKVSCHLKAIEKLNKMTPQLRNAFRRAETMEDVENLYAPFKGKQMLADRARELGLEPLANQLLSSPNRCNLNLAVNPAVKGLEDLNAVCSGVQHIIADMIVKDKDTMDKIRQWCESANVTLESSASSCKTDEKKKTKCDTKGKKMAAPAAKKNVDADKFQLYFAFKQAIKFMKPHQILAINRGESLKILTVKVVIPDWVRTRYVEFCCCRWLKREAFPEPRKLILASIECAYKRYIQPRMDRQYRANLKKDAEKASVAVFASNLKDLLLVPPIRGRSVLGVDPGFRNGCKFALTSSTGEILETGIAYLHTHGNSQSRELNKIQEALLKHRCDVIAIGNGTACRETEQAISTAIRNGMFHPLNVVYCIVNEAGASIYSASEEAKKEMPDLDINIISAVSLARRLQNPLAELVKIDPRHIGIGMYQHDISEAKLKLSLNGVVVDCVSFVGVDLNTSTEALLRNVASLNKNVAKQIINWREKNGPFINRQQLMSVKGLGPKTFEQCAGFVRIIPTDDSTQPDTHKVDPTSLPDTSSRKRKMTDKTLGKKKAKLSVAPNPLDMTSIHPESYNTTERLLQMTGLDKESIGQAKFIRNFRNFMGTKKVEDLAKQLDVGIPTLQLIVEGLQLPVNYDMREEFEKPLFRQEVTLIDNLQHGTELTGRITNMTHFGAFVDVGVGIDGLIHSSKMRNHCHGDPNAIRLGQKVKVKVESVDVQRRRIGLILVSVL